MELYTLIPYEYDKKEINPDRDFYRPENKYISKKINKISTSLVFPSAWSKQK